MSVTSSGITVENVLLKDFGNPTNSYSGWGIAAYGNNHIIRNCMVINAGAQGMTMKGNHNLMEDCQVYSTDTTGYQETDYYFLITANSSTSKAQNNVIRNSHAERTHTTGHSGHGFCMTVFYRHKTCDSGGYEYDDKFENDTVSNNLIEDCTAKGVRELTLCRGPNVVNNTYRNMQSINTGYIFITAGASFNRFENCHIRNAGGGVRFGAAYYGNIYDDCVSYSAQASYPYDTLVSGEGNQFVNCIFDRVTRGVYLDSYSEQKHPVTLEYLDRVNRKIVKDNQWVNCTFIAKPDSAINTMLMFAMRGNEGNRFVNTAFHGFKTFESRYFDYSSSASVVGGHGLIPTDFIYDHCNFYDNYFNDQIIENGTIAPLSDTVVTIGINDSVAGTFIDCNTLDPNFTDLEARDYHLEDVPGSGCIDMGRTTSEMADIGFDFLDWDFDYESRPCLAYDIGAYEFTDCDLSASDDIKNLDVQMYPNPTSGVVHFSTQSNIESVSLYSMGGKHIMTTAEHNIDCSEMTRGMYLVIIQAGDERLTKKLIVE